MQQLRKFIHYQDMYLNKSAHNTLALRESKKKLEKHKTKLKSSWGLGITSSLYTRGLVQCPPPAVLVVGMLL